ncbi:MAG: PAS domain S-box protein [Deltaproteobacteria bacterium]|nr:PAS domain S-box protein [Deltaproteobacteria bacterium]MBW2323948.1 PAS domain S-box protein [Deltaproteobacteria bacterium]
MRVDSKNLSDPKPEKYPLPGGEGGVGSSLNIAVAGGGRQCLNLLKLLYNNGLIQRGLRVLGVADANPDAPGLIYARELKLTTSPNFQDLCQLKGLNLLIDLTGEEKTTEELERLKPPGCSIVDHRGAELILNLLQAGAQDSGIEMEIQQTRQGVKKYQTILDSLPYRIMVVNKDMTIDAVNQTFLSEFELTREEALGKYCYEIRYGLDQPCSSCCLEDVEKSKKASIVYKGYLDEEGEERFDVITSSPILNDEGEIVQMVEASRDVTARVKLEGAAQQTSSFLENVIQSTVDGIVVVDTKGMVLLFNEGMERLTGYSAEELKHTGHVSSFYNIDVARENMRKMRSSQYGPPGVLNPTSMSIETKDGQKVPVTLSASLVTVDGKEIGSVGVFKDMTEIEEMRQELDEAHLQLVQSEKIASVGRMAAGIAHEINNPLSIILMYAELLEQSLKKNEQEIKDVQEVITQTLRCKNIVADLLEFSRKSIGEASAFNMGRLIEQCLNLLINLAIFHDIKVHKDIEAGLPEMVGDVGQFEQVFTNLFTNAADAMEGKGRLGIKARYDPVGNLFIIMVSDTGPGIPPHNREKVFDMFFTTKRVGYGTGLGLSLSKNIIELYGGSIRFECPPGGGTTFIIELPREVEERMDDDPVFVGMDEI